MIIDCDTCEVRGIACGDCVVGVLLGRAPGVAEGVEEPSGGHRMRLDAPERRALDILADQGLIPRLRLVAGPVRQASPRSGPSSSNRDAG